MEDKYTLEDLPVMGEAYYEIGWNIDFISGTFEQSDLSVETRWFGADSRDYLTIAAGVAFKTAEAAEKNKYAVYERLTGVKWDNRERFYPSTITKSRALRLHRRMWRWIGLMSFKKKRRIQKLEWFNRFNLKRIHNLCYCCEYTRQFNKEGEVDCRKCPIDWGVQDCTSIEPKDLGLYFQWSEAQNYKEAGKLALQIAELPEKRRM